MTNWCFERDGWGCIVDSLQSGLDRIFNILGWGRDVEKFVLLMETFTTCCIYVYEPQKFDVFFSEIRSNPYPGLMK